jgi:hypothetical protein
VLHEACMRPRRTEEEASASIDIRHGLRRRQGSKALQRATRGRPAGELSRFLSTSLVSVAVLVVLDHEVKLTYIRSFISSNLPSIGRSMHDRSILRPAICDRSIQRCDSSSSPCGVAAGRHGVLLFLEDRYMELEVNHHLHCTGR